MMIDNFILTLIFSFYKSVAQLCNVSFKFPYQNNYSSCTRTDLPKTQNE